MWHVASLSGWVPLGDSVRNVGSLRKGSQHWRKEAGFWLLSIPLLVASLLSRRLNHPLLSCENQTRGEQEDRINSLTVILLCEHGW